MKVFGQQLKELREARGLSQDALGKLFNVSRTAIHSWEKDKQEPSLEVLKKLANFFEVSVDYLVANSDDWGNVTLSAGAVSGNHNTVNSHNTINSVTPTTPDEAELLRLWKKAPPDKRAALLKLLQ